MGDPTAPPPTEPETEPAAPAEPTEPENEQSPPDDDAGPAVEPIEGEQGEWVEQDAIPASSTQFDPNRPVRTSPPAPDQQEGVPRNMVGGGNEDVPPGGTAPAE